MSKVTIIIDSDDDDDVVEILESAPSMKPMKNVSTEAVYIQNNNKQCEPERSPSSTFFNSKALPSKKQPPSTVSRSVPVLPTKTSADSSRPVPPPSPSKAKIQPKPKSSEPASPKRPTTTKIHYNNSPNPIPAPVVIYSTDRKPSENPVPLNSINKLFQRDARTVTLTKASKRSSSGLSKSSSSADMSKKFEMDKELAAIFALSSPEPSPSTSAPSPKSTLTTQSPSSAAMDKRSIISSSPPRQMHNSSRNSQEPRQNSFFSPSSLTSPPVPTRKRPINSPQNPSLFSRPVFSKKKVIYGIDDEDGEEEDLELYINHVSSRRKLFGDELKVIGDCLE